MRKLSLNTPFYGISPKKTSQWNEALSIYNPGQELEKGITPGKWSKEGLFPILNSRTSNEQNSLGNNFLVTYSLSLTSYTTGIDFHGKIYRIEPLTKSNGKDHPKAYD